MRESKRSEELVPAPAPAEARDLSEPEMTRLAENLVASAREGGVALTGSDGLLTALTRQVLQTALEVEMSEHLGYDRGDLAGREVANSRNGASPKTVRTEIGDIALAVPRDRQGSFEPQVVRKHQRRLTGFDEAVISLYGKGMTIADITAHLEQVYDTEISRDLVSPVTAQVMADYRAWATRPLDPVYPVILIDAIVLKVREGAVANRLVYVAMGISVHAERDVLGMWVGPTGGEGAKAWMSMLTDLRNRGILDVCIICCDGLRGLPEAINATWPQAAVQTCVVHLVRNSLRYAWKKYWPAIAKELRGIYTAPTVAAAEEAFAEFAEALEPRYPAMIAMWRRSWPEFISFLDFPVEVRKIIYTTNGIESLNARFRATTRRRGHFPDEEVALKVLYLAVRHRGKNRSNPTSRIQAWKQILNVLSMTYGDRLGLNQPVALTQKL